MKFTVASGVLRVAPSFAAVTHIQDSLSYTLTAYLSDNLGRQATVPLGLVVRDSNSTPKTINIADSVSEDSTNGISVTITGTDADGDALNWAIDSNRTLTGTVSKKSGAIGTSFIYKPKNLHANTIDTIHFAVFDPSGNIDSGTAVMTILATNGPPVITATLFSSSL